MSKVYKLGITKINNQIINNVESIDVAKDKVETAIGFLETLEDDDDVQNVYSNINFGNS